MSNNDERFLNPMREPALKRYLESVREWHGYIRFLGLPHLRDNPDVIIDRLFVEPRVSRFYLSPDTPLSDWSETEELMESLAKSWRLVLLGDPGSGKSTLVSWLSWQFSHPKKNRWTEKLGRLVPIPLVVRDLGIRQGISWEGLIDAFLAHDMSEPLRGPGHLPDLFERGQAFVLLDGLDEIGDPDVRVDLRHACIAGMARYPGCHWLFTSRIVGYEDVPFDRVESGEDPVSKSLDAAVAKEETGISFPTDSRFKDLVAKAKVAASVTGELQLDFFEPGDPSIASRRYLAPFTNDQIERFARNWYATREAVESRAGEGSRDLIEAIRADPTTLRLARIPNLLTMMALIHRVRARLPHGRALLYAEITQAYLQSIDDFRGLQETDYPLAQKRRWLARVAFEMQRRRSQQDDKKSGGAEILASTVDVRDWVVEAMTDSGYGSDPAAAEEFIRYVGRRSGLLLPRGPGVFAFLHLSFQEYFAALFLMEQVTSPRWIRQGVAVPGATREDLQGYSQKLVWRETLIFLFELLADQPGWTETLAEELFGKGFDDIDTEDSENTHSAVLLARLAVDPHSGLSQPVRLLAIERCLQCELAIQRSFSDKNALTGYSPDIAQALFPVGTEHSVVWEVLVRIAVSAGDKRLSFKGCKGIKDISSLEVIGNLEQLILSGTDITDLRPLRGFSELESLWLFDMPRSLDLFPLSKLVKLEQLVVSTPTQLDVTALKSLVNLKLLVVFGVTDLEPLRSLPNIDALFFKGQVDLAPLRSLKSLRTLLIGVDGKKELDLRPLESLHRLEALLLIFPAVIDFAKTLDLPRLRSLLIIEGMLSEDEIQQLKMEKPDLTIQVIKVRDLISKVAGKSEQPRPSITF